MDGMPTLCAEQLASLQPACHALHPPPLVTFSNHATASLLPCPRMESDGEEDVRMVRPASATPVEVDEDFEREFSQLMLDYQGRPAGAAGPAGGPGALRQQPGAGALAAAGSQQPGDGAAAAAAESEAGGGSSVAFKVMMKRGGREDRTRELHIPLSAGMAAHLRQKEEREAAEKAELKRWVAWGRRWLGTLAGGWLVLYLEGWQQAGLHEAAAGWMGIPHGQLGSTAL